MCQLLSNQCLSIPYIILLKLIAYVLGPVLFVVPAICSVGAAPFVLNTCRNIVPVPAEEPAL